MLNPGDLDDLAKRLNGDLLRPSTGPYEAARLVFNRRVDRHPAFVVRPRGIGDVRLCVDFARDRGLPLTVKGGGHGPTGSAVCDGGLLLDLTHMRGVWVDPVKRTATVQAGALWKDVYREAAAFGLVPPGGGCDMAGVAGSTLGGGWGFLSRSHGLAVDNLNAVQLVTADGRPLTATVAAHPDLFWALRGGGGGHFGVVTAFEYRLQPLPPLVYSGEIEWPYARAAQVLATYRDYILGEPPDRLYVDFNLWREGEAGGEAASGVSVFCLYVGEAADGRRALEPYLAIPDATDDLAMREYGAILDDYASQIHPPKLEMWKSAFLTPRIAPATIETIVGRFAGSPLPSSSLLFIETLGGAVGRVAPGDTAYVHRRERMCLTLVASWDTPAETEPMEAWAREFRAAVSPGTTGGVYVNYPDADLAGWAAAYYGDNYPRLIEVKRRYDPTGFFRFPQSIEPCPAAP
jgi:FAD/FMN-containing dehydrogenase